jgi:glycosyltransferase involved in cell wall biosynthesis
VSRRPRICLVVTSHVTALAFFRGYLSFLREDGWDVALVCSPGDGLEAFARAERVALHTVVMKREPSPLRDLVSLVSLASLLIRLRPDIIAYATPKASLLGAIAAGIAGIRLRVHCLWGLRLETATGFAHRWLWLSEKITALLSTDTVANSRSLADRAAQLGLAGGRDVVVLGSGSSHGVDVSRFAREADFPKADAATQTFLDETRGMTVGFVGRIHPDKGVERLLEALQICADNRIAVRALIVGRDEGAPSVRPRHSARDVAVRYVGEVSDPRPYLAEMDVLVLMSRREGFPNVVLEAAAMEVPAIVAAATGSVDAVSDGVTGVVVPVDASADLAREIGRLASDGDALRELGRAARERVEREFASDRVWRLHADYFRQLLSRAQRARGGLL